MFPEESKDGYTCPKCGGEYRSRRKVLCNYCGVNMPQYRAKKGQERAREERAQHEAAYQHHRAMQERGGRYDGWEMKRVWVELDDKQQGNVYWSEHGDAAQRALEQAEMLAANGWEPFAVVPRLQGVGPLEHGGFSYERAYDIFFRRRLSPWSEDVPSG